MKKAILVIAMFLSVAQSALAFDVVVQGVNLKWFRDRNYWHIAAGAATAFVVHELAHTIVAKGQGYDTDLKWYGGGPYLYWTGGDSLDDYLWTSRAGWIGELSVGLILNVLPWTRGTDFTLGYNGCSAVRAATYNIPSGGDFDSIRNGGGNSRIEWFIATGMASGNFAAAVMQSGQEGE